MRGPILVPITWLIAILGSGLFSAFCIGVWVSTIALNVQGAQEDITALKTSRNDQRETIVSYGNKITRIETILTFAFPKEAEKAQSVVPANEK